MTLIKEKIEAYVQHYEFKKRSGTLFISYDCYLTPGVQYLNAIQLQRIGHLYLLRKREGIPSGSQNSYDQVFNFDFSIKPWGNSQHLPNILRSMYDLSMRYYPEGNDTLERVLKLFLTGYMKYFKPVNFDPNGLLSVLSEFFNFPREFIASTDALLQPKELKKDLTDDETSILTEFVCLTPNPSQLNRLMDQFYTAYEQKIQSFDYFDTAVWIIQQICEIHFLEDGNGRLARRLAFDLIQSHESIRLSDQEIVELGKNQGYIDATTRTLDATKIRNWLVHTVQSKKLILGMHLTPHPGYHMYINPLALDLR